MCRFILEVDQETNLYTLVDELNSSNTAYKRRPKELYSVGYAQYKG